MRIKLSDSVWVQPKLVFIIVWSFLLLVLIFLKASKPLSTNGYIFILLFLGLGAICIYFFIPWGYQVEYDDDFLYVFKSGREIKVPLENIKKVSCSWVPIGVRSFTYYYFNFIYISFNREVEGMKKITFIKQPEISLLITVMDNFKFYKDFKNKINARKNASHLK